MAAFSPPHVKPMLHYQSTFTQSTPRRLPLTTLQPHSIQPRIVSSDDEALSPKKALRAAKPYAFNGITLPLER